jgi:hypothetical protein
MNTSTTLKPIMMMMMMMMMMMICDLTLIGRFGRPSSYPDVRTILHVWYCGHHVIWEHLWSQELSCCLHKSVPVRALDREYRVELVLSSVQHHGLVLWKSSSFIEPLFWHRGFRQCHRCKVTFYQDAHLITV